MEIKSTEFTFIKCFHHAEKSLLAPLVIACLLSFGSAVQAATLNTWSEILDSPNDSIQGDTVGGTVYEIYKAFYRQREERIDLAFNTNFPFQGVSSSFASDGYIGFGDIIINTTGQNLSAAQGELFAIRAVSNNNSAAPNLGLLGDVSAKSVASQNGLKPANLQAYNSYVQSNGGQPSIGDLPANTIYFDQNVHIPNVIASGTWLDNVQWLSPADLSGLGGPGQYTYGVSFASSILPDGSFIFHWGPECNNDVIAGIVEKIRVPEPSNVLGFALMLIGLATKFITGVVKPALK
ncbi:hypothetical protein BST81_03175 [Leptolyngbya sp. 'hensonii']|nr:hypothetical protein BST81_03175 [Leptolyngbya sp. 'hensonii']